MRKRNILIFLMAISIIIAALVSCAEEVDQPHIHDFDCGPLILRVEPSCFTDGCEVVKCKNCDAERVTVLPAYMTHIKDSGTIQRVGDHDLTYYRCTMCGELLNTVKEHRVSEDWSYSETTHWHDMLCGCDDHVDETTHFFSAFTEEYEDGCNTVRLTTRTCVTCGYEVKNAVVVPNHTPGEPELIGGSLVTRCTVCGRIIEIED